MLRHQDLILNLSLKQRLLLICSREKNQANYGERLDLGSFKIEENPTSNLETHKLTYFPSDKLLVSSFNSSLIEKIYKFKAIESKNLGKPMYFNVSTNLKKEGISEDYLVSGLFLKDKINGLVRGNGIVNIEKSNTISKLSFDNEIRDNAYELANSGETVTSMSLLSLDDMLEAKTKYHFDRLFYVTANTMEEAVALINHGATMIHINFANSDEEFISFVVDKVLAFRRANRDLKDRRMDQAKFVEMVDEGLICNEDNINEACDSVLSLIEELNHNSTFQNIEMPRGIVFNDSNANFDEVLHDNYAYIAAKESIILLKNEDNILPISPKHTIAVFGEAARENKYQTCNFDNIPTRIGTAFDAINDYDEINAIGFAYGYKEDTCNEVLLAPALNLAEEAKYLLVYLCAKPFENVLPNEQIELIKQLNQINKNIIAVVSSDGPIDMSFDEYCKAVLFTYRAGQEGVRAVLDILIGESNPTGKLAESIPVLFENNSDSEVALTYYNNELPVKYCFGHGLSYSNFIFKNLEINEKGATITISNDSNRKGIAIPQLYIEKPDSTTSLKHRVFKGYARVELEAKETKKVFIPFNDYTFRYFNESKQKFGIEGGEYEIHIGASISDIRLKGSITLKEVTFNDDNFANFEVCSSNNVESTLGEFIKKDSNVDLYASIDKNIKKTNKNVKLLVALYIDIILACVGAYFYSRQTNGYIFIAIVALIFNIFMLKGSKKSKKNKSKAVKTLEESLTALVDNTKEFKQLAKVSYQTPIKKKNEEDIVIEEKIEEAELKDEIANRRLDYDATFTTSTKVVDEFANEPSLGELTVNLVDYFDANDISIEYSSIRNLISSFAASKLTWIRCENDDLLPKFISLLNRFFGNTNYTIANETMDKPFDLYWREDNGRFVPSEFTNIIKTANDNPSRMFINIIGNVNVDKFESYFKEVLQHIVFSAENTKLELNEQLSLEVPNNIFFIAIPNHFGDLDKLSNVLANVSQVADIVISKPLEGELKEERGTNVSTALLTMEHFNRQIRDGKKEFFTKEESYKSLDDFENIISKKVLFRIGNKNALAMENFVSCFMGCGGDEEDAFIYSLTSKIVPLIKTTPLYKDEAERANISSIIDKCFTTVDMSKVKKALRPSLVEKTKMEEVNEDSIAFDKKEETVVENNDNNEEIKNKEGE